MRWAAVAAAVWLLALTADAGVLFGDGLERVPAAGSIADRSFRLPSADQFRRVVSLRDYNTRVVILGTCLLGAASGLVGSFTLLRKRALMGDALSHATLPGICLAFMIGTSAGLDAKSLPILLAGATVSGLVGVGAILAIGKLTRLKEDAALGITLSVFFGAGVAMLGVVQQMRAGHAAGLEAFIYGKTASMTARDAGLIAAAAGGSLAGCILLFKELKLLCFDDGFAGSRGFPVLVLDLFLMGMVVLVSIVGLQAVGLILMVALLVIPAAAARFWTESMWVMGLISAVLGGLGGLLGAGVSALFSRLPSGAMIVLVCTGLFFASLVFGSSRGVLMRVIRRVRLNRSVDRQHLLRALYEVLESRADAGESPSTRADSAAIETLLSKRSWSRRRLERAIRRAERARLVVRAEDRIRLTANGACEARRLTRQHRLWELFLITHADVAPSHVDREADAIEHVLEPAAVAELETLLEHEELKVPESPHALGQTPESPSNSPPGIGDHGLG